MDSLQVWTPLGPLVLKASTHGLIAANFGSLVGQQSSSPLLKEAARQVQQWSVGDRDAFDLPLDIQGTKFQQSVWKQLQAIPRGQSRSYGDIAHAFGKPGAARAVGGACSANPIILIIPCHRVLASDGKLGGFSSGLDLKRQLLTLEGIRWK